MTTRVWTLAALLRAVYLDATLRPDFLAALAVGTLALMALANQALGGRATLVVALGLAVSVLQPQRGQGRRRRQQPRRLQEGQGREVALGRQQDGREQVDLLGHQSCLPSVRSAAPNSGRQACNASAISSGCAMPDEPTMMQSAS